MRLGKQITEGEMMKLVLANKKERDFHSHDAPDYCSFCGKLMRAPFITHDVYKDGETKIIGILILCERCSKEV